MRTSSSYYSHRNGKIPASLHPFDKQQPITGLIQPRREPFWFYRFVLIWYSYVINPFWNRMLMRLKTIIKQVKE